MGSRRAVAVEYLLSLEFKPGNSGFYYLSDLITMRLSGEEIAPLSTCGYPKVGRKYKKSAATVDKSIQNAISGAWMRGDIDTLYLQFGNTVSSDRGKPGNLQFVFQACENLRCSRISGSGNEK